MQVGPAVLLRLRIGRDEGDMPELAVRRVSVVQVVLRAVVEHGRGNDGRRRHRRHGGGHGRVCADAVSGLVACGPVRQCLFRDAGERRLQVFDAASELRTMRCAPFPLLGRLFLPGHGFQCGIELHQQAGGVHRSREDLHLNGITRDLLSQRHMDVRPERRPLADKRAVLLRADVQSSPIATNGMSS